MRTIVIVLSALFALKLAVQEYIWRAATEEVLVAAYAERALDACRSDARSRGLLPAGTAAIPQDVRFAIGNPGTDVALWDFENRDWVKRFRTPYLRITLAHGATKLACAYDLTQKSAQVTG